MTRRSERIVQKAREVREALIKRAERDINATHISVGQIKAKDDTRKLLTIRVDDANRFVPYQGHATSEFTVGDYWAVIFGDEGTVRLGWWISNSAGAGSVPLQPHALDPAAGPHTGTMDVKDLADSQGRLLTGAQKTDLTDGGFTILHQHAGAGGPAASVQITLTNKTGGARAAGDVVVTDPANDESFVGTVVVGYQGKVLIVADDIEDEAQGPCWERGGPFLVNVTGAVNRNDGLRASATIYRAEAAPAVVSDGVFAVALFPNVGGEGTIKAVFLDVVSAGGAGGAWTLIQDVKLVAPAANIDFQNIPGTYKHLVIEYSLRSDRAAQGADLIYLRFNNSAVGYDSVRVVIKHANSLITGETLNDSEIEFGGCITATNAPANSFGAGTIRCRDYVDSSKLPNAEQQGGFLELATGPIYSTQGYGQWRTAAAISRITLIPGLGNNFVAGSRATLYGIS